MPSFNGQIIFDSRDTNTGSYYTQGNLLPLEFQGIRQTVHPNGANGNAYIGLGFPDRKWRFQGIISGSLSFVLDQIAAAEQYVAEATNDPSIYHTLVDSYGRSWPNAQITNVNIMDGPRIAFGNYYVAQVAIEGVIQGMLYD